MSEMDPFLSQESLEAASRKAIERYNRSLESSPLMPVLRQTHTVDISEFNVTNQLPLTSDDFDTAIQIANTIEGAPDTLVTRIPDWQSPRGVTYYRTDNDGIEEYYVNAALRYLSKRPAAPLE